jgi:hypothetical protein
MHGMSDSPTFTAAAVHADQVEYDKFTWIENPTHEQSAAAQVTLRRVWAGQDHFGGTIFRIPAQRIDALHKKVEKIEKRAEKLNVAPPTVVDTGEREDQQISKTKVHTWAYVAVNGIAPKIDGWTFLATLQHEEAGNIIRRVPNPAALTGAARKFEEEDGLAKYRNVTSKCDHCGYKRQRKDTYVVVHEDGRTMQVGTNCLADFLGGASPQQVAKGMQYIWDVIDEARSYQTEGFTGIKVDPQVDTVHYLTHVAWSIRKHGWVSKGKAYDYGKTATAVIAADNMYNQEKRKYDRGVPLWEDPSDEDANLAEATVKWVREEFDGDSDYAHNLVTALSSDRINHRSEGIAASGVAVYQREQNQKAKVEQEKVVGLNEYYGNVKDRVELTLTVKSVKEHYSGGNGYNDDGVTYIHKLVDAEGRRFTWFGSYRLEADKTYTGKWTIKGHSEWKTLKETRINRPHGLKEVE